MIVRTFFLNFALCSSDKAFPKQFEAELKKH